MILPVRIRSSKANYKIFLTCHLLPRFRVDPPPQMLQSRKIAHNYSQLLRFFSDPRYSQVDNQEKPSQRLLVT